jgi:hypothetical protein
MQLKAILQRVPDPRGKQGWFAFSATAFQVARPLVGSDWDIPATGDFYFQASDGPDIADAIVQAAMLLLLARHFADPTDK